MILQTYRRFHYIGRRESFLKRPTSNSPKQLYEYEPTVQTLWQTVKEFIATYPQHLAPNNNMDFVSNDGGGGYSLCHFWSNFELGSLNFFRSQAYSDYFDTLDRAGGFYYERWGDAPVHSIAVSLLLPANRTRFLNKIGYAHPPVCPYYLFARIIITQENT